MGLTGGYGAALTGVLNGLEAGGMAAQEIIKQLIKHTKKVDCKRQVSSNVFRRGCTATKADNASNH